MKFDKILKNINQIIILPVMVFYYKHISQKNSFDFY